MMKMLKINFPSDTGSSGKGHFVARKNPIFNQNNYFLLFITTNANNVCMKNTRKVYKYRHFEVRIWHRFMKIFPKYHQTTNRLNVNLKVRDDNISANISPRSMSTFSFLRFNEQKLNFYSNGISFVTKSSFPQLCGLQS